MDIKDISFICILDRSSNILYSYNYDKIDTKDFVEVAKNQNFLVGVYKEQTLFIKKMNDISICLLAKPESNEIFVLNAFEALVEVLTKVIKNWCVDRIAEKYDQIILIFHEFVYNGIILTDDAEDLSKRIIKRTFENINAIKVNKGFASFLNRATKSFRK